MNAALLNGREHETISIVYAAAWKVSALIVILNAGVYAAVGLCVLNCTVAKSGQEITGDISSDTKLPVRTN